MKIAFSGESLIRFLITYTNCPTVKSAGTRYLHSKRQETVRGLAEPRSSRCGWCGLQRGSNYGHALLLVNIYDVALVGLLDNDRDAVRVLVADSPSLLLALVCGGKGTATRGERQHESQAKRL